MNNEKTLKGMCESCTMPFKNDPKGTARESEKYCSNCFLDGKLTYEGNDVKEFKRQVAEAIIAKGGSPVKAKFFAFMAGFAPRWREKK